MTTMVITSETQKESNMFKSLIAASAIAATAVALAPTEASAKTNWDIHLGLGAPFYPVYEEPVYIERPVQVYRPYRPHHVYRPYVEYDYVDREMSCRYGKQIVRDAGFRGVDAYDCSAPTYGYTAWKRGEYFKVRVNYQGEIVSVRNID
jgi:hypothetical protein